MGTWSHEPFGNDSANDWAYDLEAHKDFAHVAQAIKAVLDNGGNYLDSDQAVEAVAAAEVLAKALGKGTQQDAYTKKIDAWLKGISAKPSPELLSNALKALDRVMAPESELKELWEESDEFGTWASSMEALKSALRSATS